MDNVIINSTIFEYVYPVDIQKKLYTYTPKKSFNNYKPPSNEEISIGGNKYRLMNTSSIYSLSAFNRTHKYFFIYRGANGIIIGDYVRIIFTSPDYKVDLRGIDNYKITSIPLVTDSGVISFRNGNIIIIINKYSYYVQGKTIYSSSQIG